MTIARMTVKKPSGSTFAFRRSISLVFPIFVNALVPMSKTTQRVILLTDEQEHFLFRA